MSENDLQRAIVSALRELGFWVIRLQASGRRGSRSLANGEPGLPDLYLPGMGHLEVKLPGGELSRDQLSWHIKATLIGVNVGIARTVAEAIRIVRGWERRAA